MSSHTLLQSFGSGVDYHWKDVERHLTEDVSTAYLVKDVEL